MVKAYMRYVVLPSERAQFSAIIDRILAGGDLATISAKQIRNALAAKLEIDLSEKKVSALIIWFTHLSACVCACATLTRLCDKSQANAHFRKRCKS